MKTRKPVDKKERERRVKELLEALHEAEESRTLLAQFLEDLFSPYELQEMATRWQIIKLLSADTLSYREIADELKTTVATVSRGAKEFSGERGGFRKVLSLSKKDRIEISIRVVKESYMEHTNPNRQYPYHVIVY